MSVRKLGTIFCMMLLSVCFVYAKPKASPSGTLKNGLSVHIGGTLTGFRNIHKQGNTRYVHSFAAGGLNAALQYGIGKNFGVYGLTHFTFGSKIRDSVSTRTYNRYTYIAEKSRPELTYAIDSQFGLYYLFHAPANVHFMLGLGLGLGGNGNHIRHDDYLQKTHVTNMGAGFNFDVLYMFSKMIGIYGGISDNLYAPIAVDIRKEPRNGGSKTKYHYSGSDIQNKAGIGTFSNSFNLKIGVRLSL